jgi:hypothetical protein
MRVGINTGFGNAGNFCSKARMDIAIGGEVSLSARPEYQADTGGTVVSQENCALVHAMIDAENRSPVGAKSTPNFSRPAKRTDNRLVEAIKSRLGAGCRNAGRFLGRSDAREKS